MITILFIILAVLLALLVTAVIFAIRFHNDAKDANGFIKCIAEYDGDNSWLIPFNCNHWTRAKLIDFAKIVYKYEKEKSALSYKYRIFESPDDRLKYYKVGDYVWVLDQFTGVPYHGQITSVGMDNDIYVYCLSIEDDENQVCIWFDDNRVIKEFYNYSKS